MIHLLTNTLKAYEKTYQSWLKSPHIYITAVMRGKSEFDNDNTGFLCILSTLQNDYMANSLEIEVFNFTQSRL